MSDLSKYKYLPNEKLLDSESWNLIFAINLIFLLLSK